MSHPETLEIQQQSTRCVCVRACMRACVCVCVSIVLMLL
jgi:hypothetical protein